MIRFHDSWLEEPALRDWLVKVSNDETRAYCRCCSIVLRAHKADLTTHSATVKHAKNTESANLAGVCSGPISVQIVPSDEQQVVSGNLINTQTRGGPYSSSDTNSYTFQRSPYAKRFRPEWQLIDELKDWLEPCQEDPTKAYCKMCDVQLRSHKHDLLLHGRSTKHKRCSAAQATLATTTTISNNHVISVEYENELSDSELVDNKMTTTQFVSGQIESIVQSVVREIPCKKPRLDMTEGSESMHDVASSQHQQQQQHDEILPHESRQTTTVNHPNGGACEEDPMGEVKPQQINIIRVIDKPKNSTSILYSQDNYRSQNGVVRRRRGRINAADVIRAVELNEFTGYEMLQILKSIAPKL